MQGILAVAMMPTYGIIHKLAVQWNKFFEHLMKLFFYWETRVRVNYTFLAGISLKYLLIGYPLRPWLLTPFQNPAENSPEQIFNNRQKTVRSIVERCNGVLKNRFRCLLKHRVLHYSPDKCGKIINACVVLHNLCIHHNIPEPDMENPTVFDFGIYLPPNVNVNEPIQRVNPDLNAGRLVRQTIVNEYFTE